MRRLLLDFRGGLDLLALCSALAGLAGPKGVRLRGVKTKWGFSAKRATPSDASRLPQAWREALRRLGIERKLRAEPRKRRALAALFAASYEAIGRPKVLVGPIPLPVGFTGFSPLPQELLGLPVRGEPDACEPDPLAVSLLKAVGARPALPGFEGVAASASVGAGKDDAVCRAVLLGPVEGERPSGDVVAVLEAVVDDMPPEFVPPALEALLRTGALDAFVRQVSGKKGRPAFEFVAICPPDKADEVEASMLGETTTIGLRRTYALRTTLEREERTVQTRLGPVRVKVSRLPDGSLRAKPEFDDCLEISRREGLPPQRVWLEALEEAEKALKKP